jgi:hypothetical protein
MTMVNDEDREIAEDLADLGRGLRPSADWRVRVWSQVAAGKQPRPQSWALRLVATAVLLLGVELLGYGKLQHDASAATQRRTDLYLRSAEEARGTPRMIELERALTRIDDRIVVLDRRVDEAEAALAVASRAPQ